MEFERRCVVLVSLFLFLCAATAVSQQPDSGPLTALRAGFQSPPQSAKLRCYWWWLNGNTTRQTITRDLQGMKSHGYGGAILVDADGSGQQSNLEAPLGPAIGSPQWTALFVYALREAKRLGLEISWNITSRWDVGVIGGATVKPEDAMKLLTWSSIIVTGGSDQTVNLKLPRAMNGFYHPIAALTYPLRHGAALPGQTDSDRSPIRDLKNKTASVETGFSMPADSQALRNAQSVVGEQDADTEDVVDVTSAMNAKGTLHWRFPAGQWEVLSIGYTDTQKTLKDQSGKVRGLPLDALNAGAFDRYWQSVVHPVLVAAKPYVGNSLHALVTDSWEAGGANWTDGFRAEFERRRGYDPISYLPVVTGRIINSRDDSNRFLFDLRRTVADLIAENYYDHFAARARAVGLETHPEAGGPHGAPIDALENFRSTTYPQTEFWAASNWHRVTDQERFYIKEASSAAHIYGKPFVAAEGPTSMARKAWSESLGENVQPTFDQALAAGLNRLFWHEFTSSPASYGKPGEEYFAGTHLNPNVTWWDQAPGLLLAFNRAQFLMQQGEPVEDVLYFYGEQVPGMVRVKSDDPAHVLPGYDYDVTDEDALLNRMQYRGADLHTPEGIHYRALVLPQSGMLSESALEWVNRFVRQGGVVIGKKPHGTLGILKKGQVEKYNLLVDTMWAGCDATPVMRSQNGKGLILCTADAHAALTSLNVDPDFTYSVEKGIPAQTPAFDFAHRQTAQADIYFVRSTRDIPVDASLSFRVSGRMPELWNTGDGSIRPAAVFREEHGRTLLPIHFPAHGSAFFVFANAVGKHVVRIVRDKEVIYPSIAPGQGVFADVDGQILIEEPGSYELDGSDGNSRRVTVHDRDSNLPRAEQWTLSFPPNWGAPEQISVPQFQSWTESRIPGVRYFSGTATYHSQLKIDESELAHAQQFWIDLGTVREIATVIVNGHRVQTVWRAPYRVRIDKFLHEGENAISIDVSNFWPNRIIGDLQSDATRHYTHTNVRAYTKDSPLLPSGLLKPVRILRYSAEQPF
ncbi:MAG: hypothetical protein KGN79_14515 [Acidobacteriota bacterium]|nr:hypothetical protein [Acidobacteriota bacterium]